MGNEIAISGEVVQFMPSMTIGQAVDRHNAMTEFVRTVMGEKDYGKIPGSDKPTLLKPGAEKLITLFGLSVDDPEIITEDEDWTGEKHGGEAFFNYKIRQRLSRHGQVIASQMGSCNSRESKYRYRQADRICPQCSKPTIIKGRAEYGGGWLCFAKKGGCGFKFPDGDKSIESQQTGRIANPDIADLANTILKMAQKRALIAATLVAVNASEFFTQDMEDIQQPHAQADHAPEPQAALPSPSPGGAWGGRETAPNGKADPVPPKKPLTLNPVQVTDLKTRIEGAGEFDGVKFCKHYHIESGNPYDLPPLHFDDAMNKLSRKPARKPQLITPAQIDAIDSLLSSRGVTVERWEEMLSTYTHSHTSELLSIQAAEIIEDLTAMQPVEQGIVA